LQAQGLIENKTRIAPTPEMDANSRRISMDRLLQRQTEKSFSFS